MKCIITVLATALSLALSPLAAQNFDKGLKAHDAGNYDTALREWEPLAEQGNIEAQYNLGFMYDNGQGLTQDKAEAVKWYRLAAEQAHGDAQLNLGAIYRNGIGVPQDFVEAANWYRLAAEQGNAIAQDNLGILYYFGDGVTQSNLTAYMWINLAFENGAPEAGVRRDFIAEEMAKSDISKAQDMSKECISSAYTKCSN